MIHYFPLKATWKCDTTTCPEANKKHFFFFYFCSHITANGFFFHIRLCSFLHQLCKDLHPSSVSGVQSKDRTIISSLLSVVSIKTATYTVHFNLLIY